MCGEADELLENNSSQQDGFSDFNCRILLIADNEKLSN